MSKQTKYTYQISNDEKIEIINENGIWRLESNIQTGHDFQLKWALDGMECLMLSCVSAGLEFPDYLIKECVENLVNKLT